MERNPSSSQGDPAGKAAPGEWLDDLADALPVGIFVVDEAGRVVLWNRLLNDRVAPAQAVLGRTLAQALPRFTDPMRATDFRSLIVEGAIGRGATARVDAYPRKGPDGVVRLFDISVTPLRASGTGRRGAAVVWWDVTASRRHAERALRNARTSALASFGASIAHEIRNPLNSIALNLQLLQEGIQKIPGEQKEELLEESAAVLEEIETLNRLVGDVLRFARNPAPSLSRGNASEAVVRALKLLSGEARKNGVRLARDLDPLDGVRLDEDMLSRAVYNIGLNAIQAMPEGGTLTIRTEARPHSALIEIADTGPGVDPGDREKIFALFYSRRRGGTGLGLPLAHRVVEAHGGYISVENASGGGAVFQIHLPWATREGEEEA